MSYITNDCLRVWGVLILLQFLGSSAVAQLDYYKLSDYKYPDVGRKVSRLSPDIFYSNANSNALSKTEVMRIGVDFSGWNIANTREFQKNFNYQFSSDLRRQKEGAADVVKGVDFFIQLNLENRFFLKPKRFIELASDLYFDFNDRGEISETKNFFSWISVAPKYGFGRIENVTDAWQAMVMLEELKKQGYLIEENIGDEEIERFAQVISDVRNYRNPDGRLEDIAEFQRITEFLIENKYVHVDDYGLFAIIKDVYDFESFVQRQHGSSFKAGPEFYTSRRKNNLDLVEVEEFRIYSGILKYERFRAIDAHWQLDQTYAIKGGVWNFSPSFLSTFNTFDYYELSADITLGNFLSQRTFMSLSAFFVYRNFLDNPSLTYNGFLRYTYNYYISPKFRINLNASFNLLSNNDGASLLQDRHEAVLRFGIDYFFH